MTVWCISCAKFILKPLKVTRQVKHILLFLRKITELWRAVLQTERFSLFLLRESSFKICLTSFVLGGKKYLKLQQVIAQNHSDIRPGRAHLSHSLSFGFYVVELWGSEVNSLCSLWRCLNTKQRQHGLPDLWYVHYIVFVLYREAVVLARSGRHIRAGVWGLGHSGCICQYFNQSKIFIA